MSYGIALIDYNSGERTCKFLHDFISVTDFLPQVIVIIDNYMSDDWSFEIIKSSLDAKQEKSFDTCSTVSTIRSCVCGYYHGIRTFLIKASYNLGYARANNMASKIMEKRKCDAILFSNSDILFHERKFNTSFFLKKLETDHRILGIGSDVISLDGKTVQSPCQYLSIEDRFWRGYLFWPLLKKFYKPKSEVLNHLEQEQKVYRLSGSFFFVNTNNFFAVEGFDNNTFLYTEEAILAEKGSKIGLYMYYIPGCGVIHEGGFTTVPALDREVSDGDRLKNMVDLSLYYYKTYKNVSDVEIFLTKVVIDFYVFKKKMIGRLLRFS